MDINEQIKNVVSTSPVATKAEAEKNIKPQEPEVNPENIAPLEPKRVSEEFYKEQGLTKESIEENTNKIEQDVTLKATPKETEEPKEVPAPQQVTQEVQPTPKQDVNPDGTYPIEYDDSGLIKFRDYVSRFNGGRFNKVAPYEVTDSFGNILKTDEKDPYKIGYQDAVRVRGDNGINYLGYTPVNPDEDKSENYNTLQYGTRAFASGVSGGVIGPLLKAIGTVLPTWETAQSFADFNLDPNQVTPFDLNTKYIPNKRENLFLRAGDVYREAGQEITKNTYKYMNQGLANEVFYNVFNGMPQYATILGASFAGGPALGVLSSALLNTATYYDVRDRSLETGASMSDAYWRGLGAFGTNALLDYLGAAAGGLVTKGVVTKIINKYGLSDAAMKLTAMGSSIAVGGLSEGVTETLQNRTEAYFSGDITAQELLDFTHEDYVTFLSSLILGAMGGGIEGRDTVNKITKDRKDYNKLFNDYMKYATLGAKKFESLGLGKAETFIEKAREIWFNKDADVKEAVTQLSQEILDRFKENLPDDVKELLKTTDLSNVSQESMNTLQERINAKIKEISEKSLKLGYKLTPNIEKVIKGLYTGYASISSLFYGIPIGDSFLPDISPIKAIPLLGGSHNVVTDEIQFNIDIDMGTGVTSVEESFGYTNKSKMAGERGIITTLIHEFAHSIDGLFGVVGNNTAQKQSFTKFFDSYVDLITKTFPERKEKTDKLNTIQQDDGTVKTFKLGTWIKEIYKKYRHNAYKKGILVKEETKKPSEYFANAVTRQGENSAKYVGLDNSLVGLYTRAANILLDNVNQVTPLQASLTNYIEGLKRITRENSELIQKIIAISTPEKWNAAIKAYMEGLKDIDWNNITSEDIENFASILAENDNVDAKTLDLLADVFEDIEYQDFIYEATQGFKEGVKNATSDKLAKATKEDVIKQMQENDATDYGDEDGGIPEDVMFFRSDSEGAVEYLKTSGDKESTFSKLVKNEVDGNTFISADDFVYKTVMETKPLKGVVGTIAKWLSGNRGLPDYLQMIGGKKLDDYFKLTQKYNKFLEYVTNSQNALYESLLTLFSGVKSLEYSKYISETGVKNIEVKYNDPVGSFKGPVIRKLSKREVMSVWLQYQQKDKSLDKSVGKTIQERLEETFDMKEIESKLTDFDKKFALKLQEFLKRYKRIKENEGIINYFPLVDAKHREENDGIDYERGRHSDGPLGYDDALYIVQNYINRDASYKSGYGITKRRLKQIFDYNSLVNSDSFLNTVDKMTDEDIKLNQRFEDRSVDMRRKLQETLGEFTYKRFMARLKDTKLAFREDVDFGILTKTARNLTKSLLTFKPKALFTNMANITLGFGGTTRPLTYLAGFVKALANPIETLRWAKSIPALRQRYEQRQISEFMDRNSLNTESVIPEFTKKLHDTKFDFVSSLGDLVGWLSDRMGNIGMFFQAGGDLLANAFALKPLYDEYLKESKGKTLEAKQQDAEARIIEFMVNRQSSENQAVKPQVQRSIRNWSPNMGPMLFTFVNELTQKGGQIGRDIIEFKQGDKTLGQATRDIAAILVSNMLYSCIQTGLVLLLIKSSADDEEIPEEVLDSITESLVLEALSNTVGMSTPLVNIASSAADELFLGRNYGIQVPAFTQAVNLVKNIRKKEFLDAITLAMSASGMGVGLPEFLNAVEGGIKFGNSELSDKEREAGFYQLTGRTENTSRKLAGLKPKRKKKE